MLAVTGAPTVVYDPATDTPTYLDPPPDHAIDIHGGFTGGLGAYGQVVIVDEEGRASRLDLATSTWQEEAIVDAGVGPCTPQGFSLDDGRSAWDLCGRMWIRSFDGGWTEPVEGAVPCCVQGRDSTGSILLEWARARNGESAFRVWVPPEA